MLKVYWFGYGGSSWMAENLRELIEDELNMCLVTIHEHPNANVRWDLDTVYQELKKADIIILPANYRRQPYKSNNRLTQAMALGKAIICDPLPAYKDIVEDHINAIMTSEGHINEYRTWLKFLRDSEKRREELGKNARETAKKFSLLEISNMWIDALSSLEKEEVDVIIPTKDNEEILDECLKSFNNSKLDENIYIVDNGNLNIEKLSKKYKLPIEVKEV